MTPGPLARCRAGNASVEFAIMAPIALIIFVGVVDLGGLLLAKFRLNAVLNETTSYALANAGKVNGTDGLDLGRVLATLARTDGDVNSATVSVSINNGPKIVASGTTAAIESGTAGNADQCYCPSTSVFAFGAAMPSCSAPCPDGSSAGKFVEVTIARPYVPLFSSYGLTDDGTISASAVVQVS